MKTKKEWPGGQEGTRGLMSWKPSERKFFQKEQLVRSWAKSCSLTGQRGKTLRVEVGGDMQRLLKFPPMQYEGKHLTNEYKIKQEK